MIGDVPRGASLRCRLGWHVNREKDSLAVFMCGRCGGSFWQKRRYLRVLDRVREREARRQKIFDDPVDP